MILFNMAVILHDYSGQPLLAKDERVTRPAKLAMAVRSTGAQH